MVTPLNPSAHAPNGRDPHDDRVPHRRQLI